MRNRLLEACIFQAQLRRYGAIKASRRLAWRHRWPDPIRDDVLARLLALNAERYAEEQAMGLHSKGGGGRRPAKADQMGQTRGQQTEQMGLGL